MTRRIWVSLIVGWICGTIACLITPHAIGIVSQLAIIFLAGFGSTLVLLNLIPKN